jgi:hypothetical protein
LVFAGATKKDLRDRAALGALLGQDPQQQNILTNELCNLCTPAKQTNCANASDIKKQAIGLLDRSCSDGGLGNASNGAVPSQGAEAQVTAIAANGANGGAGFQGGGNIAGAGPVSALPVARFAIQEIVDYCSAKKGGGGKGGSGAVAPDAGNGVPAGNPGPNTLQTNAPRAPPASSQDAGTQHPAADGSGGSKGSAMAMGGLIGWTGMGMVGLALGASTGPFLAMAIGGAAVGVLAVYLGSKFFGGGS